MLSIDIFNDEEGGDDDDEEDRLIRIPRIFRETRRLDSLDDVECFCCY